MRAGFHSAVVYAVLLHVVLLGFLTFSFGWRHFNDAAAQAPVLAIQATVVDEALIVAELDKLAEADERRIAAEQARQRELTDEANKARAEREREQARLVQLEKERIAAQALAETQATDAARKLREREDAEKTRLAQVAKDRQAEEKRLAELAEQRRQAEDAEQKRIEAAAAEQRKVAAVQAEQKRLAALAEQRERADNAKKAELQEQLRRALAEETARENAKDSGLLDQYLAQIAQRIERNWNKPPGAISGLRCEVLLTQIPGGEVIEVQINKCNGDAAVLRSIEAAVYKASPLPPPPDPRLFERKVRVFFEPDR